MAIRRLYGTATVDAGVFWEDCVSHEGWRIQYNKTLDKTLVLKPYRLLDPMGNLWASSDTLSELAEALPELTKVFAKKQPLFDSEDAKKFISIALSVLIELGKNATLNPLPFPRIPKKGPSTPKKK